MSISIELRDGMVNGTPIGRSVPSTVAGTGFSSSVRSVTASATATRDDTTILVDATAGPVNITLLPATPVQNSVVQGQILTIKKMDSSANTVSLVGTVDGVTNKVIVTQYSVMTVQRNGAGFVLLSSI